MVVQNGKTLIDKNEGLRQYKANSRRQNRPSKSSQIPATISDETGLDLLSWGQSSADAPQDNEPAPQAAPKTEPSKPRPKQLPDYNESRARHEFEKANLAELDRKTKEGLLLPRDQVEKTWAAAVTIARTKLLATPTRARQRIPHLSLEEVNILDDLLREALEELAGGARDGE